MGRIIKLNASQKRMGPKRYKKHLARMRKMLREKRAYEKAIKLGEISPSVPLSRYRGMEQETLIIQKWLSDPNKVAQLQRILTELQRDHKKAMEQIRKLQ